MIAAHLMSPLSKSGNLAFESSWQTYTASFLRNQTHAQSTAICSSPPESTVTKFQEISAYYFSPKIPRSGSVEPGLRLFNLRRMHRATSSRRELLRVRFTTRFAPASHIYKDFPFSTSKNSASDQRSRVG